MKLLIIGACFALLTGLSGCGLGTSPGSRPTSAPAEIQAVRVIVGTAEAIPEDRTALLQRLSAFTGAASIVFVARASETSCVLVITPQAGQTAQELVARLAKAPDVRFAELDRKATRH